MKVIFYSFKTCSRMRHHYEQVSNSAPLAMLAGVGLTRRNRPMFAVRTKWLASELVLGKRPRTFSHSAGGLTLDGPIYLPSRERNPGASKHRGRASENDPLTKQPTTTKGSLIVVSPGQLCRHGPWIEHATPTVATLVVFKWCFDVLLSGLIPRLTTGWVLIESRVTS